MYLQVSWEDNAEQMTEICRRMANLMTDRNYTQQRKTLMGHTFSSSWLYVLQVAWLMLSNMWRGALDVKCWSSVTLNLSCHLAWRPENPRPDHKAVSSSAVNYDVNCWNSVTLNLSCHLGWRPENPRPEHKAVSSSAVNYDTRKSDILL